MTPSQNAADLIASHADTLIEPFEGLRLTAYQDGNGIWTNGYGNTHGVVPGSIITQEQAIADLKRNMLSSDHDIINDVEVQLNQNEFDALVSLDYNIGGGAFDRSTVLRKLNANDRQGAADAFLMWVQPGSVNTVGLTRRREAERALFLTAV
jgi:lysozyme